MSGEKMTTQSFERASLCLKVLAHPIRIKIIHLLMQQELSVGELAQKCHILRHVASEHLNKMKDRGLLKAERRGKQVYYFIADKAVYGIMECIEKRFASEGGSLQ